LTQDISPRTLGVPSASALELTLSQIQGLYASRVLVDGNQDVREIHVVASNSRKPKQIIRDVETLVFVKHGLKVDYRKISLVQLADEDLLRLPMARPEIRRVSSDVLGDQRRVQVEIYGAGKTAVGEACERIDNPAPFRTAALATIGAIRGLMGHFVDIRLDNTATLRLEAREILLVLVTCMFPDHEEAFVGASFVGSQPADSGARATLDALNRRILTMMP
jgi:hypothetical protein